MWIFFNLFFTSLKTAQFSSHNMQFCLCVDQTGGLVLNEPEEKVRFEMFCFLEHVIGYPEVEDGGSDLTTESK